jgi:hypothetical protein
VSLSPPEYIRHILDENAKHGLNKSNNVKKNGFMISRSSIISKTTTPLHVTCAIIEQDGRVLAAQRRPGLPGLGRCGSAGPGILLPVCRTRAGHIMTSRLVPASMTHSWTRPLQISCPGILKKNNSCTIHLENYFSFSKFFSDT